MNFSDIDFSDTQLSHITLVANLSDMNFSDTDFSDTQLSHITLVANISDMNFSDIPVTAKIYQSTPRLI